MSNAAVEFVFAGIAVTNYRRAVTWYAMLFGRPPDVVVRDDIESMWQIKEAAWVYIVQDSERAGKSLVTILVTDLEGHLRDLSDRGIEGWALESVPGLYCKASLTDMDGNTVAFGENLQKGK
jgi:hypothetical protein